MGGASTKGPGTDGIAIDRVCRQFDVEQFYFTEAALLDARRYREWLALMSPDIRYWMPIRRTTGTKDLDREFTQPGAMAFFDDDLELLQMRVHKLETGYSWAEDPPSRTRHLITNVRILEDDGRELSVECNFHVYRTRLDSEEDNWFGRRLDRLRRLDGGLQIAHRSIFLDQTVLLSRNLSNFF